MPIAKKPTPTSKRSTKHSAGSAGGFSAAEVAAAKAAADAVPMACEPRVDWRLGEVTAGGGVQATVAALRRTRGPNKKPAKQQVAIRLDQDLVSALRASGPGWQTRVNTALREWLDAQASPRRAATGRTSPAR